LELFLIWTQTTARFSKSKHCSTSKRSVKFCFCVLQRKLMFFIATKEIIINNCQSYIPWYHNRYLTSTSFLYKDKKNNILDMKIRNTRNKTLFITLALYFEHINNPIFIGIVKPKKWWQLVKKLIASFINFIIYTSLEFDNSYSRGISYKYNTNSLNNINIYLYIHKTKPLIS
jgi:hypothetical protein